MNGNSINYFGFTISDLRFNFGELSCKSDGSDASVGSDLRFQDCDNNTPLNNKQLKKQHIASLRLCLPDCARQTGVR